MCGQAIGMTTSSGTSFRSLLKSPVLLILAALRNHEGEEYNRFTDLLGEVLGIERYNVAL